MMALSPAERTPERFAEASISWASLRAAIDERRFDNPTWKGLYYFFRDAILYGACVVGLCLVDRWYVVLPLWLVGGSAISALFIVGHDASHGALFKSHRLAQVVGRLCMLPALHPFSQWSYGHNRVHHGKTVELGFDPVWHPLSPREFAELSRLAKLRHRFYWSAFGAGFYYLFEIWLKQLWRGEDHQRGKAARWDKALTVAYGVLFSGALFYGGGFGWTLEPGSFDSSGAVWMWSKVFAVPFLLWNYNAGIVVFVQHIREDIPWQAAEDSSTAYGQLFATVNFHVPAVVNIFVHNILIHVPHHVHVRVPFYHLDGALADIKAKFGAFVLESNTPVRDYLRAVNRCKVFDPKTRRWQPYPETSHRVAKRSEHVTER